MQRLLPQWRDLRDTLEQLNNRSMDLNFVVAPAGDVASAERLCC
jgi:hypothetical protein